ncbi:MAG: hypothetical protein B6I19_00885, partial [Bacteroidetes bacterium 4572_114]
MFSLSGQSYQVITHVDTLQSEDVIVTITDGQGNLINLSGQSYQVITHVDTLQSEDVIVTITDGQGNLINKGLAGPGFKINNDTTYMVYPTGGSDENPEDVFYENIDLPGNDGGFLPKDVVFNTHNDKYYIYGFRKIMIC